MCLFIQEGKVLPQTNQKYEIAGIYLKCRLPNGGSYFSIVHTNGNWASWFYFPPDQASGYDGWTNNKEFWTLSEEIIQSDITCRLDTSIARTIVEDLDKQDSKLNGKAFLVIVPVDGEIAVYERAYNTDYQNPKLKLLNKMLFDLLPPEIESKGGSPPEVAE